MPIQKTGAFIACLAAFGLANCGLGVPDIKEAWDADIPAGAETAYPISATAIIEFEIRKRIYCELKDAIVAVDETAITDPTHKNTKIIPPDWIAQASLSLQVDESSALNPGVLLNDV